MEFDALSVLRDNRAAVDSGTVFRLQHSCRLLRGAGPGGGGGGAEKKRKWGMASVRQGDGWRIIPNRILYYESMTLRTTCPSPASHRLAQTCPPKSITTARQAEIPSLVSGGDLHVRVMGSVVCAVWQSWWSG